MKWTSTTTAECLSSPLYRSKGQYEPQWDAARADRYIRLLRKRIKSDERMGTIENIHDQDLEHVRSYLIGDFTIDDEKEAKTKNQVLWGVQSVIHDYLDAKKWFNIGVDVPGEDTKYFYRGDIDLLITYRDSAFKNFEFTEGLLLGSQGGGGEVGGSSQTNHKEKEQGGGGKDDSKPSLPKMWNLFQRWYQKQKPLEVTL